MKPLMSTKPNCVQETDLLTIIFNCPLMSMVDIQVLFGVLHLNLRGL